MIAYKTFRKRDGARIHCKDIGRLIEFVIDELELMELEDGDTHSIVIGAYETSEEEFALIPVEGDIDE